MHFPTHGLWLLSFTLLASTSQAATPQGYRLEILKSAPGTSTAAHGVGEDGSVVGRVYYPGGYRPVVWEGNGAQRIGQPLGQTGLAYGINRSGKVVGTTNGALQEQAFAWQAGSFIDLEIPSGFRSLAHGVNDAGTITGCLFSNFRLHAAYWNAAGQLSIVPIPTTEGGCGYGINASGTMVGYYTLPDGEPRGWSFDGTTFATMEPFPGDIGSSLLDINDDGVAIGTSRDGQAFFFTRAVLWDGTTVTEIPSPDGAHKTRGVAINNRDQVLLSTNTREYLHQDGQTYAIEELYDRPDWEYNHAYDINDLGQIVGVGVHDSRLHAYRLTPCLANIDRDPDTDSEDFELFYRAFAIGDERADVDGNGVVDAVDEQLFLQAYANGC